MRTVSSNFLWSTLQHQIKLVINFEELAHWDFEHFDSSNHISPLLKNPQGCQECQKNRKDLRFHTWVRFCTNIQYCKPFLVMCGKILHREDPVLATVRDCSEPKLKDLHKNIQNQQKPSKYAGFLVLFWILCNFNRILPQKHTQVRNLQSFWFFRHHWHPWG